MPYSTMTEKPKATTKLWFGCLLQLLARKRSGSILGHTHTYTYLLTCPDPHGANVKLNGGTWYFFRELIWMANRGRGTEPRPIRGREARAQRSYMVL